MFFRSIIYMRWSVVDKAVLTDLRAGMLARTTRKRVKIKCKTHDLGWHGTGEACWATFECNKQSLLN